MYAKRGQRGRRVTKRTVADNQMFGHARRERRDSDQIDNGVPRRGRYFKTQMGCRRRGKHEKVVHCCLHSSAFGAFEPAAGARRRSCGELPSSESFTWSVSVGGGKECMERAGLARGHSRPRTNSPPHHRPHRPRPDPRSHHLHPQSPRNRELCR